MYQSSQQYLSSPTEEPTVTLGNHHQGLDLRKQGKYTQKQYAYHNYAEQECQVGLKNKLEKELQICHSQMQALKEQIEQDQKQKVALEQTIIHLKRERASADADSRKLFQQNQKNRQLVQKLKIDNKSMEMEISKFRGERKVYYNNLNNIETLKRDISTQLAEKNSLIDELSNKLRKIQRVHTECKFKLEQFEKQTAQKELEKQQLKEELKATLEKYLNNSNIVSKLEFQLSSVNELNKSLKERVFELQKQKDQLLLKLGYDLSNSKEQLSDSMRSTYPTNQRSMIEIQSYMKEIGNQLDLKKEDMDKKRINYEKLRLSIQCLQRDL